MKKSVIKKLPIYIGMAGVVILISTMAIVLSHCATDNFVIPKPEAFFNIERYDTVYTQFSELPVTVELNRNSQAKLVTDSTTAQGNKWLNIYYPRYRATVYCSYVPITKATLDKHIKNRIERIKMNARMEMPRNVVFEDPTRHSSAALFFTSAESISPLQFIATDSINYLFSGALYFDNKVSEDSIAPVVDYITDDVIHMLQNLNIKK